MSRFNPLPIRGKGKITRQEFEKAANLKVDPYAYTNCVTDSGLQNQLYCLIRLDISATPLCVNRGEAPN